MARREEKTQCMEGRGHYEHNFQFSQFSIFNFQFSISMTDFLYFVTLVSAIWYCTVYLECEILSVNVMFVWNVNTVTERDGMYSMTNEELKSGK